MTTQGIQDMMEEIYDNEQILLGTLGEVFGIHKSRRSNYLMIIMCGMPRDQDSRQ